MLTPVSGSSSDKYAVFKELSVNQPAEPSPPVSGSVHSLCSMSVLNDMFSQCKASVAKTGGGYE